MAMGAGTCQHTGDDPECPWDGAAVTLRKVSMEGWGGVQAAVSAGVRGRRNKLGKSLEGVLLLGLGTSNKTEGDLKQEATDVLKCRENVTAQGLAMSLLTSRHTPFGIFFIFSSRKKPKQLN